MDPQIIERAKSWLTEQYDEETRKSVQNMLDNDPNELTESFYRKIWSSAPAVCAASWVPAPIA